MTLTIRTFLSRPGQGAQLIGVLQRVATTMIQARQADSVLLCQQSDRRDRIFWIENSRGAAAPGLPAVPDLSGHASLARSLAFLDGFYRFPVPPCQVWSLDVRVPSIGVFRAVRTLLRVARAAADDLDVAGLAIYRDLADPSALAAFLALAPGVSPDRYFTLPATDPHRGESRSAWHPLSVTWTMGRLSSAGGSLLSSSRYPATAFWARAGRR